MRILLSLAALSLMVVPVVYAEDSSVQLQTSLDRTHFSPGINSVYFSAQLSEPQSGNVSIQNAEGNEITSRPFENADYVDLEWDGADGAEGVYTFVTTVGGLEDRKTVTLDTTPPIITHTKGTLVHHPFETPWTNSDVSSNEGTLTTESTLSVSRLGTSTITYIATDKAGNTSRVEREIVIDPQPAVVTLSNLTHTYDGSPKSATVHVDQNARTQVTYNGAEELPHAVGTYAVHAEIQTYGYTGSADATLTIVEAGTVVTVVQTEVEKTERVIDQKSSVVDEVYAMLADVGTYNLDIEELQRALIRTGHLAIPAPTGFFGPLTQTAVRFYQLAHKLPATGYVDPQTLSVLEKENIVDEKRLLQNLQNILGKVEELAAKL